MICNVWIIAGENLNLTEFFGEGVNGLTDQVLQRFKGTHQTTSQCW